MIASEFKAKREAAKLTQEQLADKMGCTARTVRNYENGTGSLPDRAVKMLKLVLKK
jgi:transcriptional regulator with XRE-family HTH domain